MSPIIWAAFVLVLLIVLFLMLAFLVGRQMSEQQYNILKVLSSLCAALAGWFISGEAFLRLEGTLASGPRYLLTGTSGFVFAFIIWLTFPKYPKSQPMQPGFNAAVPGGWTFRQTVDAFVKRDNAFPHYDGFKPEELDAPLREWEFETKTISEAILGLRSITKNPNAIREYDVKRDGSNYHVRILDQ